MDASGIAEQADLLRREAELDPGLIDDGEPEELPNGKHHCTEPGCEEAYPTERGLNMHVYRTHVPPEVRAERERQRVETRQRKAEAKKRITPEVQALINASLVAGSKEKEARYKRWQKARKKNLTAEQFEAMEVERFARIVAGERKPRVAVAAEVEAVKVDTIFAKVDQATRALFPDPNDLYGLWEEITELRKHMFEVLSR